jgi:hypothetical protein
MCVRETNTGAGVGDGMGLATGCDTVVIELELLTGDFVGVGSLLLSSSPVEDDDGRHIILEYSERN